jgi:membrane associated rhomboid family serine protease
MSDHESRRLIAAIQFPSYLVILLWLIHIFKLMTGIELGYYGNLPRDVDGIVGIFTSPFIHGSFSHLLSNSFPLFVLTFLIALFYRKIAYQSMFSIYLLTGLAVWAFGRGHVIHIGASGVVYGLVAFVFWMGLFRRDLKSIILALIVTILYSGFFYGIIPTQRGISWESHLFGGLVGIFVAYWFRDTREESNEDPPSFIERDEQSTYLFPPDLFEQTKNERLNQQREGGYWKSDSTI